MIRVPASALAVLLSVMLTTVSAFAQVTSFTYQGALRSSNAPANGSFDFEFGFYDVQTGGTQLAAIARPAVTVSQGLFTVQLDALGVLFDGQPKYVEIRVRQAGSGVAYDVLAPRQLLMSAPFAVRSLSAANADNATNATFAQQAQNATNATNAVVANSANTANAVTGVVPIANGGTGASTAADARSNLQLGTLSTVSPTGTASATTFLRGDNKWVNPNNEILVSASTQFSQDDRLAWTPLSNLQDDSCFGNIPLGFTFTGWGQSITSISLTGNGLLFFGQDCVPASGNTALPTPLTNDPVLAFFWDDLNDFGTTEFADYATLGSPGGRVFNLYFRNRLFGATACGTDAVNLMISIHEGSNLVTVSYSNFSACSLIRGGGATFGMQGPGGANAKFVNVGVNAPILDDNANRQTISYLPPRNP